MILHGLHAGPLFQSQPKDIKNCYNVDVKRIALKDASVARQICHVHSCASVQNSVTETKKLVRR